MMWPHPSRMSGSDTWCGPLAECLDPPYDVPPPSRMSGATTGIHYELWQLEMVLSFYISIAVAINSRGAIIFKSHMILLSPVRAPFILLNIIISLLLLLLCILHMCPNSPGFLHISFCMICMVFSFSLIQLYKSVFLTFCIHPILCIFL